MTDNKHTPNKQNMTNKHNAGTCPKCGCDDNVQSTDSWPLGGGDGIIYDMMCNECGTQWEEHYESIFIGHKNIKSND